MAKRRNYFSQNRLRSERQNAITESKVEMGAASRLIAATYIHSGLDNFENIARLYGNKNQAIIEQMNDKLTDRFKDELQKAKEREAQAIAIARSVYGKGGSDDSILASFFSYSDKANYLMENLDLQKIANEIDINLYADSSGQVSENKVNAAFQSAIREVFDTMAKDDPVVTNIINSVLQSDKLSLADFSALAKDHKVDIERFKKNPMPYFKNRSQWKGFVQELSTLVSNVTNDQVEAVGGQLIDQISSQIAFSANGVTVSTTGKTISGGKPDNILQLSNKKKTFTFAIQDKHYQDTHNISLQSETKIESITAGQLFKNLSKKTFNLEELLMLDGTSISPELIDFIQYYLANSLAFQTSGGYADLEAKRHNTPGTFPGLIEQNELITNIFKVLILYWIGTKVIEQAEQDLNLLNIPVTFFVVNGQLHRVSYILQSFNEAWAEAMYSIRLSFQSVSKFSPSVLYREKRTAIKSFKGSSINHAYPGPLLALGSAIGKSIIANAKIQPILNIK